MNTDYNKVKLKDNYFTKNKPTRTLLPRTIQYVRCDLSPITITTAKTPFRSAAELISILGDIT